MKCVFSMRSDTIHVRTHSKHHSSGRVILGVIYCMHVTVMF